MTPPALPADIEPLAAAVKRRRLLLPFLLVLAAAGAGAYWYLVADRPSADADTLTLYGNIDVRVVNLAFQTSGRIGALLATEGTRVRPGDLLAVLDDRELALARDAARARVDAQRATLARLVAGSRPEEVRKLREDLAAAEAEAKNAAQRAERSRELLARKLTSPQDYDDASTLADANQAHAAAARAALDLALAGTRAEDIDAARALLAELETQLASAEVELGYARLYSPAEAIVQNRVLEPGDMAAPERPVLTLALVEPLWARVYLAEPELGRVRQGQPAAVFTDSYPGKAYPGWVGYIAPSAEFTPKTVQTEALRADLVYQARVFVCNRDGELRLGMPVTVQVDIAAAPLAAPGCAETKAAAGTAGTGSAGG